MNKRLNDKAFIKPTNVTYRCQALRFARQIMEIADVICEDNTAKKLIESDLINILSELGVEFEEREVDIP